MKKLAIIILLLSSMSNLFSQKIISSKFYNTDSEVIGQGETPYYIEEIIKPKEKTERVIVQQTYSNTDNTKLLAAYKNAKEKIIVGKKIEGFENGNYKSISTHDDKGRLIDTAYYFHENGKLKLVLKYPKAFNNEEPQILNVYTESGEPMLIEGNGMVMIDDDNFISKGSIQNYKKIGAWQGTFKKYNATFKEFYENGELKDGVTIDSVGNTYKYDKSNVAKEPDYFERVYKLKEQFAFKYQYSKSIHNKSLNGNVEASFLVDKNGFISNIKVNENLGYGIDLVALDVLDSGKYYRNWTPAILKGMPVDSKYKLTFLVSSIGLF